MSSLKAAAKKQLEGGIHAVAIKNISFMKGPTGQPASWIDPANGQPTGALEILYVGKGGVSIKDSFWLALGEIKKLTALMSAIGLDNKNGKISAEEAIGKKLWLGVATIMLFDIGMKPVMVDGVHASIGKAMKRFWPISKEMPVVDGNPIDNNGVASGDFLFYQCEGKIFKPTIVETVSVSAVELAKQYPLTESEVAAITKQRDTPSEVSQKYKDSNPLRPEDCVRKPFGIIEEPKKGFGI